jgi:DNA-binding SARP family transcriptional activator
MRLFALNNDRTSALHVYHTCATILKREMGVDPAPATREIGDASTSQATRQGLAH